MYIFYFFLMTNIWIVMYEVRLLKKTQDWLSQWKLPVANEVAEYLISIIVRRAGLLLSQQDFEWRWSVPLFQCLTVLEFSFILFDLCL